MFRIYYLVTITALLSFEVAAVDVEQGLNASFNIKGYLDEQVTDGIYSEYTCPAKERYSFDNKEACRVSCLIVGEVIFNIDNVKAAYFSQSPDRVAVVIDLFKNGKETDTIASFSSEVSCIFTGLTPHGDRIKTQAASKIDKITP